MDNNRKKQKYINKKCHKCGHWNKHYQYCEIMAEDEIDNWVDFRQICNKNNMYEMSDEEYYDAIIRENTQYYEKVIGGEI